jgi:Tfp pilus assembly protein PilO
VIRGNLATRPFYNEPAVHLWLFVAALVVVVATLFNVVQMLRYSRSDTELARQAANDEARATELRAEASRLRATVDAKQIERASLEAHQANELIDRRTFSWTALWNEFEATLPPNVRITSFRPRIDPKRGNVVTITLVARSVDDAAHSWITWTRRTFPDVLPPSERTNERGQLETTIEVVYAPSRERRPRRLLNRGKGTVITLTRRIITEKRRLILPVVIAIVANVAYALVVYPLAVRSAGAADRAAAAAQRLAAEREPQVAKGLIPGKAQAEEELNAFYKKALPANVSTARSLTYVPVIEIARRNDVNYVSRAYEDPEELHPEDNRRLGVSLKRLTTRVVLQGDYESIRAFIYELEQAPQFVVIDQVTLLEAEEGEPVTLTVTLSTFYREANAA